MRMSSTTTFLSLVRILLLVLCWYCAKVVALDAANGGDNSEDDPFEHFLTACAEGNLQVVEILLEEHPDIVTGQSRQGESCLHAAGIYGQTAVTKLVLQHGGNPNQRSTFAQGLRMTPLSWNVYGGHVETARALLEAGGNVNMDFDHMTSTGELELFTALDLLYSNMPASTGKDTGQDTYYKKQADMRDLLLKHGAKQYFEIAATNLEKEL
jgi:Ankyrin repeats (3 copies)